MENFYISSVRLQTDLQEPVHFLQIYRSKEKEEETNLWQ